MRQRPPVSVCVPAYHGVRWLREALDSALAQDFRDFELLVVDDASTDGTADLAREYAARDPRVRVRVNARRLGLVGNWNRAVTLARGTWVKFLFQDDRLAPDCLSAMLAAARPQDDLVVCRRRPVFEPGTAAGVRALYRSHLRVHSVDRRFPGQGRVSASQFAELVARVPGFNCLGEPTAALVRRSAFSRLGPFDADLAMLCDWELLARVAASSGFAWVPRVLADFRVHAASESSANRRGRRFRAEVADELLVRAAALTRPAWAPVRRVAARLGPAADLRRALAREVHLASDRAARYERAGADPAARATLAWALSRSPLLAELAAAPDPRRAGAREARARRTALALWRAR